MQWEVRKMDIRGKIRLFKDSSRQFGIILVILLMILIFSYGSDVFFTYGNFISILQQTAIKGVMAVGMTLIIISGGIDLSAGAIAGLSSMVAATIMTKYSGDYVVPLSIIVALLIGIICGFINGALIAFFDLQPFLVTMGTMSLFRGLDYIYSGALPVRNLPQSFLGFMNSMNSSVPIPVIILLSLSIIAFLGIKYSRYGRHIFAVGGNEEATRLSGINVREIKIRTYIFGALTSVLAGIIYIGRLSAADPKMGDGYELDAIAAAAIGGASMSGGKGGIIGSLMGAFMLAMLANGLTLLNIQSFYQTAATGVIIIIAVLIDKFSNK